MKKEFLVVSRRSRDWMRHKKLMGLARPYLEKNDLGADHTERVLNIAKKHHRIPKELQEQVVCSIILHDIGGSTIEEQYNRGPEIAANLLGQLGYSDGFARKICETIRTHHERLAKPSKAFRILYDADQLAKLSAEEFLYHNSRKTDWNSIIDLMYYQHSKALARKMLNQRKI